MKSFPRTHIIIGSVLILVALAACTAPLADGEYVALGDSVDPSGWAPVLVVQVEGGEPVSATFDYINRFGDVLSTQSFVTANLGSNVAATLDELSNLFIEGSEGRGNTPFVEDYAALSEAVRESMEGNNAELRLVAVDGVMDLNEVEFMPWLSLAYLESPHRATRGGSAEVGEEVGGISVVASHRAAVEAGMEVLRRGGTAADAIFVTATVMGVVEPYFSSPLGGGTWILYYDKATDQVYSVDGVGPAPLAINPEDFLDPEHAGRSGIHRSILPGSWAGYTEFLKRFGTMPLDELLEPAIRIARDGVEIDARWAFYLSSPFGAAAQIYPKSREIYAPGDSPVNVGDIVRFPDMANTYQALADAYALSRPLGENAALEAANDYFYRGPVAEGIVAFSEENGGYFTMDDFEEFSDYGFVDPVMIDYRGLEVYQNPPNSQGMAELIALNILENFDFSDLEADDAETVHIMAEALKLAFIDRNRYIADPAFEEVPIAELLDKDYAQAQFDRISMDSSIEWPMDDILGIDPPSPTSTTTFHAVDAYGNAVALTTSIGLSFMVAGDTGIHMNERLSFMHNDPADVNTIVPGKKPRHTSGPHLVMRDGEPYIVGGNTGADFQPQGQLQQFIWVVEFGMSANESIAQPRFTPQAFAGTIYPFDIRNRLGLEAGRYSEEVREELAEFGQNVEDGGIFGSANMIIINDHEAGDIDAGWESREENSYGMVEMP